MKLRKQLQNFIEDLKIDVTPGTVLQYRWHIQEYLGYLNEYDVEISGVEPILSVKEYIDDKIKRQNWSRSMVNVSFYALKWFWEKSMSKPLDKRFFINRGKKSIHNPRILTRDEVNLIWKVGKGLGIVQETMIHLGWDASLRRGELVTLKGENFLDDVLDVRVLKTKRARKRVKLHPKLYERIQTLIEGDNKPVFRRPVKEGWIRRYTPGEWSYWFHRWSKQALRDDGVRWHDFARHTRLTHYAEDTKSFIAVLQLSGHQNPRVCRQYFERAKIEVPELSVIEAQKWDWLK